MVVVIRGSTQRRPVFAQKPRSQIDPELDLRKILLKRGYRIFNRLPNLTPLPNFKPLLMALILGKDAQRSAFILWQSVDEKSWELQYLEDDHIEMPYEDFEWLKENFGLIVAKYCLNTKNPPRGKARKYTPWYYFLTRPERMDLGLL